MPFSVKDLVVTRGVRTTFGTPLYRDHVPTEDAPIVERLKAAGAILLGKTNTPTFGWIGATHNLLFGPTRNPWHLDRTPGGSSGGASAAAAAGLGPLHVGTERAPFGTEPVGAAPDDLGQPGRDQARQRHARVVFGDAEQRAAGPDEIARCASWRIEPDCPRAADRTGASRADLGAGPRALPYLRG